MLNKAESGVALSDPKGEKLRKEEAWQN